jgi:hypothetical protein
MERTDMMVGEGETHIRSVGPSRHRPDGESRLVPEYRMLWMGNALIGFAHFPTIYSVLSNAAVLRLHSRHVVGFP